MCVQKFLIIPIVQVGLIMGAAGGDEAVTTISSNSSCNISDGLWHSVVVRKSGSRILLLTDQHPSAETDTADWPQIIQTNSDLFIGGVPSQSHDIDSIVTVYYSPIPIPRPTSRKGSSSREVGSGNETIVNYYPVSRQQECFFIWCDQRGIPG